MQREIKFRGLRTDGKGWVYGDLFDHDKIVVHKDKGIRKHEYIEVIPESVGQFTGLKDKNGKDIYEGDICSGHSDGDGVVTWTDFDGGYDYVFDDGGNVGVWEVRSALEIIGNIHEQK